MAGEQKTPDEELENGPEKAAADEAAAEAARAAEDEQGAAAEEEISLEAEIAALRVERDELKDRLMRALAEAENARKRGERDRKDAETYGGTRLARDLLSVHDNLGRALETVEDDLRARAAAFIEGVELTQRELLAAFAKHRIELVNPEEGEKFDPKKHQAMFEAPVPGATPGTVIQVMQPGFTIADRLLRPAMVGVAAAAPKPEAAPEAEEEAPEAAPKAAGKAGE